METIDNKIEEEVAEQREAMGKMAVTFLLLAGAFLVIAKMPGLIRAAVRLVFASKQDTNLLVDRLQSEIEKADVLIKEADQNIKQHGSISEQITRNE